MPGLGYLYIANFQTPDRDLATAEMWTFTQAQLEGHLAFATVGVDISRSAFLRHCVAIETTGATLEDLVADCLRRGLAFEGFSLEILRPPPKVDVNSQIVARQIANAITGRPNLTCPQVRLAVVATEQQWYCGRLLSEGHNNWKLGIERPFHFSSALPQRFSRAIVNLVASPGDTLLDPCCGIGTPLIEALEAGVVACGSDTNPKMLRCLAENLRYLGLPLRLIRADARCLAGTFDGVVLDLPYGRNLHVADELYRDILTSIRQVTRRAVIVSAKPLGELLDELGFVTVALAQVPKGCLVRHVHLVEVRY